MAVSNNDVHRKAKAFVDSLSKLKAKEREQTPKGAFGQDFNTLRDLALEAKPDIDKRVLPPAINIAATARGESLCEATYAEIETYARQIVYAFPLELGEGFGIA